jgi:receptor expression-enhancing protein 5/6
MSESPKIQNNGTEMIRKELKVLEDLTGVNSKYIMISLAVCSIFVLIGYFDFYITNIVGIVYPAIWSIRAIESKGNDDDKQWLTYWVVFAIFTLIDLFSGFILKFIPFYFFIKLLFLIWCFMPNTRGAILIYDKVIIKLFYRYEDQITKLDQTIVKEFESIITTGKEVIKDNQGNILAAGYKVVEEVHKKTS